MKSKDGYAIHEVFYRDDGSVDGWTAEPLSVTVDTIEGLRHELNLYLQALDKPALENHGD
jgi:hypothetical protein